MEWILAHMKAVLGGAVPFLGGLQIGFLKEGLSASEFFAALIAGLVGFGTVFGIANKGQESAQAVVDQVKALVPPQAAAEIDKVVPAARGVLKTVL